jgi:hypothetical protein
MSTTREPLSPEAALARLAADPAMRAAFNAARIGPNGSIHVPALAPPPRDPLERARFRMEQAFPGSIAVWDKAEAARTEAKKREASLRRFRRTMRRLEKRAPRTRHPGLIKARIAAVRRMACRDRSGSLATWERYLREDAATSREARLHDPAGAYLLIKAADAVARYAATKLTAEARP